MRLKLFLFAFLIFSYCSAQKRNNIWCFGDSAGIDFNSSIAVPFYSSMDGRGSCASISDTSGQLLFYAQTLYEPLWAVGYDTLTAVFNKNNVLMQGGDSIVGEGWYRELVITDRPGYLNQYYLFSTGITYNGLFYSVIDMNQNGGLGAVTQKNVQILPYQMQDGLQAIKHGNGRDWWIVCKRSDIVSNDYYFFLLTPTGISGPFIQSIGTSIGGGFHKINFSPSGNRMLLDVYGALIEFYDFDRCSGILSNPYSLNPIGNYHLWACELSPSENMLYISNHDTDSYLIQVNLLDTNPWASRDTLWVQDSLKYTGGDIRLAPDGKIYYASSLDASHWDFPYADSEYYAENMNLGVINFPDSLGSTCQFQPYSFYLGGKRTYVGLPNNPNYDMPAIMPCDTITTLVDNASAPSNSELFVYYHSTWQVAFINAKDLKGKNYVLSVYDLMGREVYSEEGKTDKYFTKDLNCDGFAKGMYIIALQTDKEALLKRWVKE